jgi:hypothetical protein
MVEIKIVEVDQNTSFEYVLSRINHIISCDKNAIQSKANATKILIE